MQLKPGSLEWDDIITFLKGEEDAPPKLSDYDAINASRTYLEQRAAKGTVYGVNTGFGKLAKQSIAANDLDVLQERLLLSHAAGVGVPLARPVARLMLLLKINALAQGYSGVRSELIELLLKFIECDVIPRIPRQGSVGASGDLAPLAHMSLPIIGHGECLKAGNWVPAKQVLDEHGIAPLTLKAKEGLALLNGMQASNAIAIAALARLEQIFDATLLSGAMTTDAVMGSDAPFDKLIHMLRQHPGQLLVANKLRFYLKGSAIRQAHANCDRVQDPYSLRCQPQVMGACLDQINHVKEILVREANAVTDNPLVFANEDKILSGGNFHGEPIAFAADILAMVIAEIGNIVERRLELLIDPEFSGLPAFLVQNGGLNSGYMIAQYTAAALASENKCLSMPRSVDTIPTSANQEDHVSMATNAALRLDTMLDNLEYIVAIEYLFAAQAIDLRRPLKSSEPIEKRHALIRSHIPRLDTDRYLAPDIEKMREILHAL